MYFNSLAFGVFLAVVWLVYQFTPDRHRWLALALASLGFYASLKAPLLLFALGLVAILSYALGHCIARQENDALKLRLLWVGIAVNIGVLCLVKYLQPIAGVLCPSLVPAGRLVNLFVTIGVSYFTLQAICYLADIYLGRVEPERHLGRFALYLGFFPKLLQGPIERAGDLLPQLQAPYRCSYENMRSGALLFAWGLFKKTAVANRLALYVNTVYGDVHSYGGVSLLMATYMYAIQIYADFSGYTDMALGVARFFNIRLTQNFNSPYLATSVADFWRRWHISFSRWILDYIFRPLQVLWRGGGNYGTAAALLVTFLFSGLWHGVAWGFVIWGLLHGTYLAGSVFYKPWASRIAQRLGFQNHPVRRVVQTVVTFHLVCMAWIFFRAGSVADGWYVLTHLLGGVGGYLAAAFENLRHLTQHKELVDPILLGKTLPRFLLLLASLAVFGTASLLRDRIRIQARSAWVRWPAYYLLASATAFLGVYNDVGFVYFQF
jgi:D-alanyl-lipoteichoic acid acyltransferase DltB (MBOAT superfamily)